MFFWEESSSLFAFFFNDTATTEIYTLSLHDALPILLWIGGKSRLGHAVKLELDALARKIRAEQIAYLPQERFGRDGCELGNTGLGEPEKIFDNLIQAADFFSNSGRAEVLGSARGNGFLQCPKPRVDRRKGLFDLVRQPGGELSEMGKFAFGGALVKF